MKWLENKAQQEANRYIETVMAQLTKQANTEQFEHIMKENIQTKKASAKDEQDYFDRLMLNITYFVENKAAWMSMMRDTFGKGLVPQTTAIQSEATAHQMRIRQAISEKMDDYTKLFHSQYKALKVTEEAIVYDYAYASVEHSLRFDFLIYLTLQKDINNIFLGDFEETLRIVDGYVAYYADQCVNQMELL
ncbi:DNA helicase [Lysinibacillus sp. KU-BSD001]